MTRRAQRLSNLDIDEVSLVDIPANQHGRVAIAKSHQEEDMPDELYDGEGNLLTEDDVLEDGDLVYDAEGNELEVQVGAADEDDEYEDEVGKAAYGPLRRGDVVGRAGRAIRGAAGSAANSANRTALAHQIAGGRVLSRAARAAEGHSGTVRGAANAARNAGERAGRRARNTATAAGMQYRLLPSNARAGIRYGGTAAAGGGGSVYVDRKVRKSAGQAFLDSISKAVTDEDRDEVFAEAVDQIETIAKRNEQLEGVIADLLDQQEFGQFTEVAKSYELGVDETELGGVLQRAAQYLPAEDVQYLDSLLASTGQISKAFFAEQGLAGNGTPGGVMDQVLAVAGDAVSKSAGAGLSQEQAVVGIFQANPDAYDEYEREMRSLGYGN